MRSASSTDRAHLWRLPDLQDLELLRATYRTHAFARHWHETYVVEVVEEGVDESLWRGRTVLAGPGDIVILEPYEVHTGRPTGGRTLRYRSLYPSAALLAGLARSLGPHPTGGPRFPFPIVRDAELATEIAGAHRALEESGGARGGERLFDALERLVARHGAPSIRGERGPVNRAVERARRHLDRHQAENVPLVELARMAGVSPFHLVRAFRREIGLPPHEYQVQLRVERAKRLLRAGVPISRAAQLAGFADQSHLTRRFKRAVGVTPGQYFAKGKSVQDPPSAAP